MYCETKTFTIGKFFVEKNSIDLSPEYQRESGLWGRDKQQLFLDTLFNQYDVPKIYMHALKRNGGLHSYALVDGKQRLQCIWDFLNSKIPLESDNNDFEPNDPAMKSQHPYPTNGNLYRDLSNFWQEQFKAIQLDVVIIHDAEPGDIDSMFYRLNNGEPLSAAEKRNAMTGDMCTLIREIPAEHKFFNEIICVSNRRLQHLDIAARFLLIEEAAIKGMSAYLTLKKRFLDALVLDNKSMAGSKRDKLKVAVTKQLNVLVKIFDNSDPLLKRAGHPQLYYLFAKEMDHFASENLYSQMRKFIVEFNQLRTQSLELDPQEKTSEKHAFLDEFERLMQQANDKESLKRRVSIMTQFFLDKFPETKVKDKQRNFSDAQRYVIYNLSGRKCHKCEKAFKDFDDFEADHVIQWAHGGETSIKNARALCRSCNAKSNARIV